MAKKIQNKMGFNEPPFRAKYGNQPVEAIVDGRWVKFKSKLEYRWAQHLDLMKTAGLKKDFFYEFHTFRFKGENAPKEYTPDFLVRNNDNSFEYFECKGLLQKYDLDKFKALWDERPDVKLTIVFWRKPRLSVQKQNKLKRYLNNNIIWNARDRIKDEPIDMN